MNIRQIIRQEIKKILSEQSDTTRYWVEYYDKMGGHGGLPAVSNFRTALRDAKKNCISKRRKIITLVHLPYILE